MMCYIRTNSICTHFSLFSFLTQIMHLPALPQRLDVALMQVFVLANVLVRLKFIRKKFDLTAVVFRKH